MNGSKRVTGWLKDAKGDTIVEILMAICILAVGILAVVTMQTVSLKGNTKSSSVTDGVVIAMDQIEQLMGLAWTASDLDSGSSHTDTQGQYAISWTVTDNGVISGTKTVDMTVTWSTWGSQRTVSVQQVIAKII